MTPTLVRRHPAHAGSPPRVDAHARARDWAEIQERMLVPLYEAVYERLGVGAGTRLLGLGCGSGLALLLAASRGAAVTGVDTGHTELLALARERLLPGAGAQAPHAGAPAREPAPGCARLVEGAPGDAAPPSGRPGYDVVTVFEPLGPPSGGTEGLVETLGEAAPLAERGGAVVLAGWGPAERCATASVLRVAAKLADPVRGGDADGDTGAVPSPGAAGWRPAGRDRLEEAAQRAGLRPDGSGRVACPFGYADTGSAVRGLRSTGLFDAALAVTDEEQVEKELAEALHPHVREDGTVWMPNVFRYLVARRG